MLDSLALLDLPPWANTVLLSVLLILAAWVANWITKQVLVRALVRLLAAPFRQHQDLSRHGIIPRLAHVVPALILGAGVGFIPGLPEDFVTVVRNVCNAFVILTVAMSIAALLNLVNSVYQRRPDAANRPIKGYLEVIKIIVYAVSVLLMIATLIDRSPLILLSGLGAMAAVLMLIFQDTLLSLVASVQIASNDMLRVGDWIEMPQLNADGFVIDIALHTVKVQNWDKTITTLPTKRLITEPFKNWRGMFESGGRRIKRSIFLDQNSVRFLSQSEAQSLTRFALLRDYLERKNEELTEWNAKLAENGREPVNTRRITNIGTFRAYVDRYLRNNPYIHQDMTLLVRQMAPGPEGLPLEIYCFTTSTAWADYEGIQSDIYDHLLAILPEFGLRVFQQPSGADMRGMVENFSRAELADPNQVAALPLAK